MKKNFLILSVIGMLFVAGCAQSTVETEKNAEPQSKTGNTDPNLQISVYDKQKTDGGTTLFTDGHDANNFRVLEVNMDGEIVWEYDVPQELIKGQPVGFDAELLENAIFSLCSRKVACMK